MNSLPAPSSADALLFDLGRVVLDIDFDKVMRSGPIMPAAGRPSSPARFVVNDSFRHHETGQIDDAAFFGNLRTSLGIAISDEQFLEGWNAIFAGEMPGIARLLARAGHACRSTPSPTPTAPMSRISRAPMPTCSAISARSFCPRASGCENRTRRPTITW